MATTVLCHLLKLPNEIIEYILSFCSVEDYNSLKFVCKRFADILTSEHFWQKNWPLLVHASGLDIKSCPPCVNPTTSYISCTKRLLNISYRRITGFASLPKCPHCGLKSVCDSCLQETNLISLDVGSKTTWIVTPHGSIQRHPTILVLPTNLNDVPTTSECLLCNRRQKGSDYQPQFVIHPFCSSTQHARTVCDERNLTLTSKLKVEAEWRKHLVPQKPVPFSDLWLELPFLYLLYMANSKFCVYQPTHCFTNCASIDCLKLYIDHVISKFSMSEVIKKSNASLVFCEPYNCSPQLRWKLCAFFFQNLQVNRLCFLSKGLAVSSLLGLSHSLVIDSGANNTVVYVVLNERVQTQRTQYCPVGGLNIAKDLYVALQFSGIKKKVYGPSLDSSRLKRSCYLALNPTMEQKKFSSTKQKVFVRFLNRTVPSCEVDVLQMGTELFLVPEIHYTAQDLPRRIQTALNQLTPSAVELLLSNIVLTGSNTELRGFATRLTSDLQQTFPEFRNSIRLRTHRGGHSWDAAIGAMSIPLEEKTLGSVFWINREEFVLKGEDVFTQGES